MESKSKTKKVSKTTVKLNADDQKISKSAMSAMFRKVDIDQMFDKMAYYYNPSDLVRKLGGVRQFQKLLIDIDIKSCIDKRLAALSDTNLVWEGKDKGNVDFFTELFKPHEDQLKSDYWYTTFNGIGVEQILYNENGEKKVTGFRREEFWRFMPEENLREVKVLFSSDRSLINTILPWGKWVVTTYNATSSKRMGEPLAENLIQPWIFKCTDWDNWIDFLKRFSNGYVHAKVDGLADQSEADEWRSKLEQAGKSAILVTDKNPDISMIMPNRDSTIYKDLDSMLVGKMQRLILGETLTSQMEQRGSSGAAAIHNDVRLEKTRADIKFLEKCFNETMKQIAAVFEIQGELPEAKIIYETGVDNELAQRDQTLSGIGVKFTKKYFVNNYGLEEDDFEVDHNSGGGFPFAQKKRSFLKPNDVKEFLQLPTHSKCGHSKTNLITDDSISRKGHKSFREKEELTQYMLRTGESPITTDDLIAAITLSKSSKELDENLARLFDTRNNDFSEDLTMALYNAAAKGALLGNPKNIVAEDENA